MMTTMDFKIPFLFCALQKQIPWIEYYYMLQQFIKSNVQRIHNIHIVDITVNCEEDEYSREEKSATVYKRTVVRWRFPKQKFAWKRVEKTEQKNSILIYSYFLVLCLLWVRKVSFSLAHLFAKHPRSRVSLRTHFLYVYLGSILLAVVYCDQEPRSAVWQISVWLTSCLHLLRRIVITVIAHWTHTHTLLGIYWKRKMY